MQVLLFDLDNTLYPPERRVFSLIDRRINHYMSQVVGIPEEQVDALRRRYWADYGATLQGLIRHYGIDPEDYLDYVHDIDLVGLLQPDPRSRQTLSGLPGRKFVFTNGSRAHALRVINLLDLAECFEDIFDIRIAAYQPKPLPDPYHKVLERLALPGEACLMVEDSRENLKTAKALGMKTVLVGGKPPEDPWVDLHVSAVADLSHEIHSLGMLFPPAEEPPSGINGS